MNDMTKCDWRNPAFRVFHKGNTVAIGTPKELQVLFNMRHRALKAHLLRQVAMDEEDQLELKFQVVFEADYQQAIENLLAYGEAVRLSTEPTYTRPADLEEECLMFQPNSEEAIARLKKQRCRFRRYRLKSLVPARLAAAAQAPAERTTHIYSDGYEIETDYGELPLYLPKPDTPALGARLPNGGIDWSSKRTPLEEEYLKEKRRKLGLRPTSLR